MPPSAHLRSDQPEPIVSKYRDHLDKVKSLVPFNFGPYRHSLLPHREAVPRISDIFRRNYAAYDKDVWPVERRKIEAVAAKLNSELEKFPPIYGRIVDASPGIAPDELLVRGLEAYLAGTV